MPKYQFEGSILKNYSGEVEADNLDEARSIVRADMEWHDEWGEWTEIDWIEEVGAE